MTSGSEKAAPVMARSNTTMLTSIRDIVLQSSRLLWIPKLWYRVTRSTLPDLPAARSLFRTLPITIVATLG
jgi:hypothetical protein